MPAEKFQQPAIGRLRKSEAAAVGGQTSAEDAELSEAQNHPLRNFGVSINGNRIDFCSQELLEPRGQVSRGYVERPAGIGQEPVGQILPEE